MRPSLWPYSIHCDIDENYDVYIKKGYNDDHVVNDKDGINEDNCIGYIGLWGPQDQIMKNLG